MNDKANLIIASDDNITYPSRAAAQHVRNVMREMIDGETDLLDALVAAHGQVDMLLAMVATLDRKFMPSESVLWPGVVARHALLKKYGRFK